LAQDLLHTCVQKRIGTYESALISVQCVINGSARELWKMPGGNFQLPV